VLFPFSCFSIPKFEQYLIQRCVPRAARRKFQQRQTPTAGPALFHHRINPPPLHPHPLHATLALILLLYKPTPPSYIVHSAIPVTNFPLIPLSRTTPQLTRLHFRPSLPCIFSLHTSCLPTLPKSACIRLTPFLGCPVAAPSTILCTYS